MPSALLDLLFWIAVASCAVAQVFILRAVLRVVVRPVSNHAEDGSSPAAHVPVPRRSLEILWAILPFFFLAAAFFAAWRVMHPTL